ncbi:MAG: outer membrane lipoprotein carrier protein LolA [Acidobacteria bacterium]|nr:MAG: outer membrane lipoprotein carrier protein LolA [Acidobacteriota bacterium]
MLLTLLALALAANPAPDALDRLAGALRASPGWRAAFVQQYVPEGFDTGTTERGGVTVAPPARLRFDYTSGAPRVFATDGSIGRLVDPGAGTCDAIRLDAGVWARLPLSAVLDPGAARHAFVVETSGAAIRLVPRAPTPDLAEVTVTLGADQLPAEVTVRDASGNRNRFTFSGWRRDREPPAAFFQPSLPGSAPCLPEE